MANGNVTCWGEGYLGDGNGETTKTSPGLAWVNLPTAPQFINRNNWGDDQEWRFDVNFARSRMTTGTTASPPKPTRFTAGAMERLESLAMEQPRNTISLVHSFHKPVLNFGNITAWAIHPALPTGLAMGGYNLIHQPPPSHFTIYANNSILLLRLSIQVHLVRVDEHTDLTNDETDPLGVWLITTAVQAATSMELIVGGSARAPNSGRTTRPTIRHG